MYMYIRIEQAPPCWNPSFGLVQFCWGISYTPQEWRSRASGVNIYDRQQLYLSIKWQGQCAARPPLKRRLIISNLIAQGQKIIHQ
jgi:hypothetical protein